LPGTGGFADPEEMVPESMVVPQLLQGAEPETMTVPVVPQSEVTVPPMVESEYPPMVESEYPPMVESEYPQPDAGAGSQLVGAAEQPEPLRAWSLANNPPPPQDFFACRRLIKPVRPPPQPAIAKEPKLETANATAAKATIRKLIIQTSSREN
jgi:hypothetical protein